MLLGVTSLRCVYLHLHPIVVILCPSSPLPARVKRASYAHFGAHQVTLHSCVRMTGLLPVFASLCVYCFWAEMKRVSAARRGTAGGMRVGTVGVVLPNAHTQRNHQNKPTGVQLHTILPPTLFQRVINL